ncbi:aldo/keto reductase [Xylariaceae sp. FL1272]|nr:aldo/keto reductase [Xylariaceae sp. FL1272]
MALLRILSAALLVATSFWLIIIQYRVPTIVPPVKAKEGEGGLSIPRIGIGTWLSDRDKVAHAVEFALKSGYEHIDAALIYKNEDQTGKGIQTADRPRDEIWVTSKLWNADHRPTEATAAIQQSLRDLGLDYLDLYLIHWPVAFVPGEGDAIDHDTTIVDTWRVMENLVRSNLTRKIGISNFSKRDVETIMDVCLICPYAHEFETHPYLQQQDFVDYHKEIGVEVIAYSPLANTNPTYKGKTKLDPIFQDAFWKKLAEKKNATVAQAILAWGLQRGTVVIPKSTNEKHISENLGALDVHFTEKEMRHISKQDKKARFNNPGKGWGVKLFEGLDDAGDWDEEL